MHTLTLIRRHAARGALLAAAALAAVTVTTVPGVVLGQVAGVPAAQAATSPMLATPQLCWYFPPAAWGDTPANSVRHRDAWEPSIRSAPQPLKRYASRLARYASRHPHATETGGRWMAVYLYCNQA